MSYEMRQLRKEDLSLYYYIKHHALVDFMELEEDAWVERLELHEACEEDLRIYAALTEWCEHDDLAPNPTERGRGWVYLKRTTLSGTDQCVPYVTVTGTDPDGNIISGIPEQSEMVKVYDCDGVLIPEDEYMIDYLDGRLIFSDEISTAVPCSVDYYWHYVCVVDEWAAIEASKPPVVVIDLHGTDKMGYQLGPGRKIVRKVDLHVFATNPAERNDIVESLVDALHNKTAPLYDFPVGTMLDYDGTWFGRKETMNKLTSLFNRTTLHDNSVIHGNMLFENVTARHVSLPLVMTRDRNEVMLSDLNAYRSKVSFDLITYVRY